MIFACASTMIAGVPSGHGESNMSKFKPQIQQSLPVPQHSNKTFCVDRTSDVGKNYLVQKGMASTQSFNVLSDTSSDVPTLRTPLKAEEQTYALTVNLKFDREEVFSIINTLVVSNNDNSMYFNEYSEEWLPDELVFMVPEGNYDVVIIMDTNNTDFIVLGASEIDIDSDTEISLDVADATVEIRWNPLLTDGTTPRGPSIILDPETDEFLDTTPGNMLNVINFLEIVNRKNGTGGSMMFDPNVLIVGDTKTETGLGNIKIMPGQDYVFYYKSVAIGYDGTYVIPLMSTSEHTATVTNDISNYLTLKSEFAKSRYQPDPITYEENGNIITKEFNSNSINYVQLATVVNGVVNEFSTVGGAVEEGELKNWIHICQDPAVADEFMVLPMPQIVGDWDWEYRIVALPVMMTPEGSVTLGKNNISDFNAYNMLPDNFSLYLDAATNPWLSFILNKTHVWNYGCPTMVFSSDDSPWGRFYGFTYIGRLGERRGVDQLCTIGMVSVDGDIPSDEVLEELQWGQLPEQGNIAFEFTDTNVIIGDLPGKNVTRLGFDMSREDWCPPTLQIVRFVDTNGEFTDCYAEGIDGVIEFYGGDFTTNYNLENYNCWYTEEPATEVKVEYAPYGTEEFLPLEVENVPEKDFMPGFGTYYRGSLAGIDRKSENGWFDVRITLTDASGNYQEQTLSPAFKIDSCVGVDRVAYPEIAVSVTNGNIMVLGCQNPVVEVYSADGIMLNRVNGQYVEAAQLGHGIYLVNVTDGAKRVMRKVIL